MGSIKTPMQSWLLNKLIGYLTKNEGCELSDLEQTAEGQKAYVQDAFGFRYSIEIKAIGRINSDTEGLDLYAGNKKSNFLSFTAKV